MNTRADLKTRHRQVCWGGRLSTETDESSMSRRGFLLCAGPQHAAKNVSVQAVCFFVLRFRSSSSPLINCSTITDEAVGILNCGWRGAAKRQVKSCRTRCCFTRRAFRERDGSDHRSSVRARLDLHVSPELPQTLSHPAKPHSGPARTQFRLFR
jgi:hypothetical protein